jgi:cbb3-type cytochrome oxidase maturation protein
MSIIFIMIPLSLILVACGCWAFFWAVGAGQFDELDAPAWEILQDEPDAAARAPTDAPTEARSAVPPATDG